VGFRRNVVMAAGRVPRSWLAVAGLLAASAVATPIVMAEPAGSSHAASGSPTRQAQPDDEPDDSGGAENGPGPNEAGSPDGDREDLLQRGAELYIRSCASCHGIQGGGLAAPDGTLRGPPILDAGEAGAFFQLTTGRMPLGSSDDRPIRKPPAFPDEDIEALIAYVAELTDGPALPDVDPEDADVARGGVLFREHCQACHSAAGAGGALSYGRAAPPLAPATIEQTAAAIRTGPGEMPTFGPDVIDDDELNEIVRYVLYLRDPEDPGGFPIGRVGPIPEGFVAWLLGMGTFLVLVAWIGTRNPVRARFGSRPAVHGADETEGWDS
jgi:ubiquinol-cytochrome c reductase cytochrome c subunit